MKKILFAFLISVMCLSEVTAASTCTTSEKTELNKIIPNIKGSYEIIEEELDPSEYGILDSKDEESEVDPPKTYYFNINIVNLTEQFYVVVTNDYNDETKTYNYSDVKDGILTFKWENIYEVTNFTIKVYTSRATGCADELQKTIPLRLPRYNEKADYVLCNQAQEFNLCQKFVTFAKMDSRDFIDRVSDYIDEKNEELIEKEEKEKNIWEKIKKFVGDNAYVIIAGGVILIGTGVGITVIVIRKKWRNKL